MNRPPNENTEYGLCYSAELISKHNSATYKAVCLYVYILFFLNYLFICEKVEIKERNAWLL